MWPVVLELEVQWRDIDAAGHVNNAAYFSFMESARIKAFRDVFGWRDVAEVHAIVAHAECDFEVPLGMGDTLVVKVRPGRVGETSFEFTYAMTDQTTGRTVASGRTVQVMYDYDAQKKRPVPEDLRKLLEDAEGA